MAASRKLRQPEVPARLAEFLARRLPREARLCVGLSGGCDSVSLLHALVQCWPIAQISAVHVHHGLSPHADAWADFCVDLADSLAVPLALHRVTVDRCAGLGLEAAARTARYAVFAGQSCDALLLAQHRGDQAETVLFNLLRGSGLLGAAGMPSDRIEGGLRILRPLLSVTRLAIETYARDQGLSWVEDESNSDLQFSRNYLRHRTLPELAERFPGCEGALAGAAERFGEAQALLDELALQDWRLAADGDAARLAVLRTLSLPRLKNLLRYRLRLLGWQAPVANRLNEFARQLQVAGPDRHPELCLPAGRMFCRHGAVHWLAEK